ncbi:MAG TPA: response regulator [Polyangiaceae bacterium]|jgi:two-component system chemotaxis response regulator CheY
MSATILIVDDSAMVRTQVGRALIGAGFTVVEAIDGVDAVKKLAGTPATRLIVCDVNMPRMNGVEFLERLSSEGSTLPVVMLTTEGQPELIQRAKALGAKGWIVKPFKPELLIAAVKKLTATAAA